MITPEQLLLFLKLVGAFILMVGGDICWGFYVRKVAGGHAISAGLFSVGITIFNSLLTIAYVEDRIFLIPVILGAFVGTYLSVDFDKRNLLSKHPIRKVPKIT